MTTARQPTTALKREEALAILADHQEEFRQLGVKSLALFGSVARNEAQPDSDVDLLIEFEEGQGPQGFDYFTSVLDKRIGANQEMEEQVR